MPFQVPCECGRSVAVEAAAAGSRVKCWCGRMCDVPSLAQLRRQAGAPAYTTNAVEAIRLAISMGRLPRGGPCSACGHPDAALAVVHAVCERPHEERSNDWGWLIALRLFFGGLLGYLLTRHLAEQTSELKAVHGRWVEVDLPLRLCPACRGAWGAAYNRQAMAQALLGIPEYERLLVEYPAAELYFQG